MPTQAPQLLTGADGIVTVFYQGWRFAFPDDGDRPTVTRGPAPADARPAGDKVKTAGRRMRYGRWVVSFDVPGEQKPLVLRALPSRLPDAIDHLWFKFRRR